MHRLQTTLSLSKAELESSDTATLNLIAAAGLRGAENLDVEWHLAKLDEIAKHVADETKQQYQKFERNLAEYGYSQAYFCMLTLMTVLYEDCELRYNPERIRDTKFQDPYCIYPDFSDSRDLFIHGILAGPGGTCSSMPVLVAAVGRRLGYPLKLVEVPGHCFVRWDDPQGHFNGIPERLNVETASWGFVTHPDEHYRHWPKPWSQAEIDCGRYLLSLTVVEEFAMYLITRGICLEDNGRLEDALQCYMWAHELLPDDLRYRWVVEKTAHKYQQRRQAQLERVRELDEHNKKLRERAAKEAAEPKRPVIRLVPASPLDAADVGHGESCTCAHCREQRPQKLAACNGNFGHGLSCQCFHCKQNRNTVQQHAADGARNPFQKRFGP